MKVSYKYANENVNLFSQLRIFDCIVECVCVLETMEEYKKSNNTRKYKENKIKYIPKADIEMMREDKYEASFNKKQKKYS